MTRPITARAYLEEHPELLKESAKRIAERVKEPKFAADTWRKAKTEMRRASRVTGFDFAKAYLVAHPEMNHLSGRSLEEQVKEKHVDHRTWTLAKNELGLPKLNQFGHKTKTKAEYKPNKPVKESRTYIFDVKCEELQVKSTVTGEEHYKFSQLCPETVEFLMWALKRKHYQMRESYPQVVYSRTEREV